MFEKLFKRQGVVARHKNAPFVEERQRFLAHYAAQGHAHGTLLWMAGELLLVARKLNVHSEFPLSLDQIKATAEQWARKQCIRERAHSPKWSRKLFLTAAIQWLRFIGRLQEPVAKPTTAFAGLIEDFANWMERERGLSWATIQHRCWQAGQFLRWYEDQKRPISQVHVTDIDTFLTERGKARWSRKTIASSAHALSVFFRHAGRRGWCRSSIADAIQRPRIYRQESIPSGPTWEEVKRLLASMETDQPKDIRDRAILMLFSIYGLRLSEVTNLRLEDIDWEHDRIMVRRPKQRCSQAYPLMPAVGNSIIQYLRNVRARCSQRELFLTLQAPFRPVSRIRLQQMTHARMENMGIRTKHRGPHALRHACATHLANKGLSLKEIGDHLGHRSSEATRIYAKVNLPGLREVATFDLGELS